EGTNTKPSNPRKIGVVLSGGQAPGGHNVIAGVFDALKKANLENQLFGFRGGPIGIVEGRLLEIDSKLIDAYRNTGGFDIIGSGRTKLGTAEQFEASLATCKSYGIDGIVIIGGDDSNTNAAVLAEWFKKRNSGINVIGCPKTIDGDLKNQYIETSFGFDTATKTYAELIGNIERDANSAKKYWHFIRLMGRSASHIALECALKTHPNICIISEEVRAKNMSLDQVIDLIAKTIVARASRKEDFGVVLIPEGLIEFIPEIGKLIAELNGLLAKEAEYFATIKTFEDAREWVNHELSKNSSYVFSSLPRKIQIQLLDDRDPHGNVQVSRIETEKLLIELLDARLAKMKLRGEYRGKFSAFAHFFGYEGRSAFPSNFDSNYCYGLGFSAYLLLSARLTGYIANIANLHLAVADWVPGGIPLTMMMNMEQRHGELKPVIRKALVELDGAPFKTFASNREKWALETCYEFPGPIQYYGDGRISEETTSTLNLEKDISEED
ncbi:Pyrophosphate-dependent fructose 6-phosphate-1-kinase, partial [Olavius algarvensis spirochete endosymbiont]|uniref:diphosphate--fructose-6-phosphate 1-phosphotransferase n=1 Tax=Olavius algarvensis spirochete endosymbiont TaxID=260710 RepID=UPI000F19366F